MKFKPISLPLESLFSTRHQYIWLVGAGISMDPPSNVYSAWKIMQEMINLYTPKSESAKIVVDNFRYETLIEILMQHFDFKLKYS